MTISSYIYLVVASPLLTLFSSTVRNTLGVYLGVIFNRKFSNFLKKNFTGSPVETAKQIEQNVNDAYKIAVDNVEAASISEKKAFAKILEFKKKYGDSESDQVLSLKKRQKYDNLMENYNKRKMILEITKNLVLQDLKTKTIIGELVVKMLHLYDTDKKQLKEDDVKTLVTVSEQPKLFNDQVFKIMSSQEFVNNLRNELIKNNEDRLILTKKIDSLKLKDANYDNERARLIILNEKIESLEKKIMDAEENVNSNIQTVGGLMGISEQTDYESLFSSFGELDLESNFELQGKCKKMIEGNESLTKLFELYNHYSTASSHVNEHLSTIREYCFECNSVLELSISAYNLSIFWTCVLGMAQIDENTKYTGIFSVAPPEKDAFDARILAKEHNVDLNIVTGDTKIEMEINLNSIDLNYDLVIVNSWFTYCHVKYNLNKFGKLSNKYIIVCATKTQEHENHSLYLDGTFGPKGDFSEFPVEYDRTKTGTAHAISEFLQENPQWKIKEVFEHNWGMTILQKM
uniref:Uncharacterized protein n=1 Tax=viral metagenome TaxID=1070528 RepID=A0A6C0AGF3_9ZZZZ